jgi:MFS family permease
MAELRAKVSDYGKRRIGFTVLILVALGVYLGLVQGWRNNVFIVSSWFGGVGALPPEFLEIKHRLHEFAFAMVFWPFLFGLLAQFRSPKRHVNGMFMALLPFVGLLLAFALTNFWDPVMILAFLGVPTALAAIAHPAGRELLDSVRIDRVNPVLLGLTLVAAVPLLAFAVNQIGLQTGAIEPAAAHATAEAQEIHDQHLEFGHFTLVTAFTFIVIGTGLLSSLRQPGWRLTAWVAGLMVIVYAIGGLLAPEASSNFGFLWNLGAIAWGAVFIGAAHVIGASETPIPSGGWDTGQSAGE